LLHLNENGKVLVEGGIISFKSLIKRFEKKDESLYLLKHMLKSEKDELGFKKKDYKVIQKLRGVIQKGQTLEIGEKGSESEAEYTAYFCPTFDIKSEELNNYRIKYEKPYETIIYKIKMLNPNLNLGTQDHIQITMIRDKKWHNQQE